MMKFHGLYRKDSENGREDSWVKAIALFREVGGRRIV
jgi:hypothetical protein